MHSYHEYGKKEAQKTLGSLQNYVYITSGFYEAKMRLITVTRHR